MCEHTGDDMLISVEIKTVNNRFRDFNLRIPRSISALEDRIRKYISQSVLRGHIDVNIKLKSYNKSQATLKLNKDIANKYYELLQELKSEFPTIRDDVSVSFIAKYPDVISIEDEPDDIEVLWLKIMPIIDEAVNILDNSRKTEGETLKLDFEKRLDLITEYKSKIEVFAEDAVKNNHERLLNNIEALTAENIDDQRLLTEVAIYADRISITEELTRLQSHIGEFRKIIGRKDSIGKKLDFTLQEMNRETNTIGSKANNYEISKLVVEIKSELEKMREQIQNIE